MATLLRSAGKCPHAPVARRARTRAPVGATLLLLTSTAVGCAPSYRLAPIAGAIETADYPLPSGLRLVFHRDPARPIVSVVAVVGAGGADDPDGRDGLAHVVEHLTFRATHDGRLHVREIIEGIGGSFNAYTSSEETVYLTTAPRTALPGLLRIEALRLTDALAGVDEAALATEREVVRNEMRQRGENGVVRPLFDALEAMLFPEGHHRRKSVIGDHDSLSAITLDDARAFVRRHYVPSNVTIVVSGDIELDAAAVLIGEAFPAALVTADGRPPTPGEPLTLAPRPPRLEGARRPAPDPPVTRLRRMEGDVTRPTLLVGWALPGGFGGDGTVMEMVARATEDAISARMAPRDVRAVSQVDGIGCGLSLGARDSVMTCVIEAGPGVTLDELVDDARAAYDFDERDMRASLTRELLDEIGSGALALRMALHVHYAGRVDAFHQALGEIQGARWGSEFLERWFAAERRAALLIEPRKASPPPSSLALDRAGGWGGAVLERNPHTAAIHARIEPDLIRSVAQAPLPAGVERFVLPNGVPVVMVPEPSAQIVRIGVFTGGGTLTARPVGLADFVGPGSLTRDIRPFMGRWATVPLTDARFTGIEAPRGNAAAAVHAFGNRLETLFVAFYEPGYRQVVDFIVERKARDRLMRGVRADEGLTRALYRSHPLGFVDFDREALRALGAADYDGWFERVIAPANATVVVVGGFEPAAMRSLLVERLGGWRDGERGAPAERLPPPPAPPERGIVFELDPDATQTGLQIACLVDGDPMLDMARAVVAEVLRVDLWQGLREKTGSAYSPYAATRAHSGGNARLDLDVAIQSEQTVAALEVVFERLARLAAGEIALPELREAQWRIARRSQTAQRTLGAISMSLFDGLRVGLDPDALAGVPERLAAVDAAAIQRVLRPCAGHEIAAVVGPEALVAPLGSVAPVSRVH